MRCDDRFVAHNGSVQGQRDTAHGIGSKVFIGATLQDHCVRHGLAVQSNLNDDLLAKRSSVWRNRHRIRPRPNPPDESGVRWDGFTLTAASTDQGE
jgi:hypothetical protein